MIRKTLKTQSLAQRTLAAIIPALAHYDTNKAINDLGQDPDISNYLKNGELTQQDLTDAINYSLQNNQTLYTAAKVADTVDRVTSTVGGLVELAGLALGMAPGFAANVAEETIELAAKSPALYLLINNPNTRFTGLKLLGTEFLTMGIPVGGDIYDILTNAYMTAAKEAIYEDARARLESTRRPIDVTPTNQTL